MLTRRLVLLSSALALLGSAMSSRAQERFTAPFDRTILVAQAEELAKQPYVAPKNGDDGKRLSYDQYRAIRFQKGASIWTGEDRTFTVDLFYPGFIYETPVNINIVTDLARRVLFDNQIFEYGPEVAGVEGDGPTGYSGFRVRAPMNTPDYMDEFLVFQGASYFRAIAKDQLYGLSARGLAIRTARPEGEEFPVFTDFWLERPAKQADKIVIHALLQSPSVVGAYTFSVQPGDETVMDVDATLFARKEVTAFGIGPLTSMFLFDASNPGRFDDLRVAVHDSDGLQALTGNGERIWRPLANPRALQVSAFVDNNPKGFGLLQRAREFGDYQDYEARYDRRPSLWVEPRGEWGAGHVELVEIPTDREIHDNIVAYWQPRTPLQPGQAADFSYRLRWTAEPLDDSLARVTATRAGRSLKSETQRAFVVDFHAPGGVVPDGLELHLTGSTGRILDPRGVIVAPEEAYRVNFELDPERADVVELRLVLTVADKPWSETWLYRWTR
jgi:periplasmic glucans biosynthesis protein